MSLIASFQVKEAMDLIFAEMGYEGRLSNKVTLLSARYHRNEQRFRDQLTNEESYAVEANRIANALKDYVIDSDEFDELSPQTAGTKKSVFISYSHRDREAAERITTFLTEHEIESRIDSTSLQPGHNIEDFIKESIMNSDYVLSIVSRSSLKSSWVAKEITNVLTVNHRHSGVFIPCYIDEEVMSATFMKQFADEVMTEMGEKVEDLSFQIKSRLDRGNPIDDLTGELRRTIDLKNNLPIIIQQIQESYSVNISGNHFENGMDAVVNKINS